MKTPIGKLGSIGSSVSENTKEKEAPVKDPGTKTPPKPKHDGDVSISKLSENLIRQKRSDMNANKLKVLIVQSKEYHQKYLIQHPGGYDNHYLRKISFN